jgi:hypothetical protein
MTKSRALLNHEFIFTDLGILNRGLGLLNWDLGIIVMKSVHSRGP